MSGRLSVRGVSLAYEGVFVLHDLSLEVPAGEVVAILGPSGCGKSSLLKLVGGLRAPTGGAILVDAAPVSGPGPDRAIVFQEHALFPWLDALANVEIGLDFAGLDKKTRRARAEAALAAVRLEDAAKKLVHELSGGMRQRVSIARALVLEPTVLLLDEPFSAIDGETRLRLYDHLEASWSTRRPTTLLVTHSVVEAVRLADRIVILSQNSGAIRKEIRAFPHVSRTERTSVDSPGFQAIVREVQDELRELGRDPDLDLDRDRGDVGGGVPSDPLVSMGLPSAEHGRRSGSGARHLR